MSKKDKPNLKAIVTIIVISILFFSSILHFAGVINLNILAVSDYHTGIHPSTINNMETERVWQDCWLGQYAPGTGYPYKEMMPDTKYITSFSGATGDDALSERISIVANVFEDSWAELSNPQRAYYRVSIKTDPSQSGWTTIIDLNWYDSSKVTVTGGTGWKTAAITHTSLFSLSSSYAEIFPIEIRLKGSIVGAIKTETVWEFWSGIPFTPSWETTMSADYAYLISGDGSINIEGYTPEQVPMFEIGETIPIYVSADYSGETAGGAGRWQLWAFPLRGGSGRLINEWTYDYFRETYQWILPTDAWMRGSSDSRWRIELHNTLFSTDAIQINTIDIRANAPPTPIIQTSPDIPQVGQQITIEMSAPTNIQTHEAIIKFIVRGVYTDTGTEFVDKDVQIDSGSSDPYTATTTITPPRAGMFSLQVFAHDAGGRQSENPAYKTMEMHEGSYRLTLTLLDSYDSLPIAGVKVEQVGTGEDKYTDVSGQCWFDLDQGTYSFQFIKNGYRAEYKSFSLSGDKGETVTLERTTNTWDLTVTIKDSETMEAVWGATVKVGGIEKLTSESGTVTFNDVADGEYNIAASKDASSGSKEIILDRSKDITIIIYPGGQGPDPSPGVLGMDSYVLIGAVIVALAAMVGIWYYLKKRPTKKGKKKKK